MKEQWIVVSLKLPRYEQVLRGIAKRKPARWLAIDDDTDHWPAKFFIHLVPLITELGLSCDLAKAETARAFASTFGN
jgi:hypothetical protein